MIYNVEIALNFKVKIVTFIRLYTVWIIQSKDIFLYLDMPDGERLNIKIWELKIRRTWTIIKWKLLELNCKKNFGILRYQMI